LTEEDFDPVVCVAIDPDMAEYDEEFMYVEKVNVCDPDDESLCIELTCNDDMICCDDQ